MGKAQGKKVVSDSVAAQTIEAQPVFGQIEPSKRPRASRAQPQVREKMAAFGSARQEVEMIQRRKRNEGRQKAISSAQSQPPTNGSSAASMCTDAITAISSKCSEEGRDWPWLKLDDPSFNAPIYANLFDDEGGEGYTLLWSRPRKNGE